MWILKDLECTEIVQRNHILRILRARPRGGVVVHPLFFAKSPDLSDTKGLVKSRDAKECVNC